MKQNELFKKEYIETLLQPYIGKKLRMSGSDSNSIVLEPSIESDFQIEIDGMGIKFFIQDNFYLNKEIETCIRSGISSMYDESVEFPHLRFDELNGDEAFTKLKEAIQRVMKVQIARIYIAGIESIECNPGGFSINGQKYRIVE
jgi:hypothetical protein